MQKTLEFMGKHGVSSVLDIGANVGNYSVVIRHFFPRMKLLMLEANPNCEQYLSKTGIDYRIACLSDSVKEVDFFIENDNDVGTGSSYYIENTEFFSQKRYIKRMTETLDSIVGDDVFEFVKMDTQGSEIDIIKGGSSVINNAKFVSIELSLIEYNNGAPLKDEVVAFMKEYNFHPSEMVEEHYMNGALIQEDWIFSRGN